MKLFFESLKKQKSLGLVVFVSALILFGAWPLSAQEQGVDGDSDANIFLPLINQATSDQENGADLSALDGEFVQSANGPSQISWSQPVNTRDKSQLLNGNVVLAINGGDNTTITGGGANGSQRYSFAKSDYSQLTFAPSTSSKVSQNAGTAGTGDANFDALVNTFAYATSGVQNGTQTISGLTAGKAYKIQVFYNDQRSRYQSRTMTYGNSNNNAQLRAKGNGWGQHAVGSFVAEGSRLELKHIANGFKNVHFVAILVVESPGNNTPGNTPGEVSPPPVNPPTTDAQTVSISQPKLISQGVNGNALVHNKDATEKWGGAGDLYVRERTTDGSNQQRRAQAFIKFDLNELNSSQSVQSATLRLHQNNRKNSRDESVKMTVARVLENWDVAASRYPQFFRTRVDSESVFGDSRQFGTGQDAAGFYEIDVTDIVAQWHSGAIDNNGFRLSIRDRIFAGTAFSTADIPSTAKDERPTLIVSLGGSASPAPAPNPSPTPAPAPNPSPSPSPEKKPNIILLMTDDQGWGDANFNGAKSGNPIPPLTPNLDKMAQNGLVFNRFYAGSTVCSPTRATVLTGRTNYRVGIPSANKGHLPTSETTIAEVLKAEGYRTGHFGKWHVGTMSKTVRDSNRGGKPGSESHYSPPWLHGFDVSFSTEAKVPTFNPMKDPSANIHPTSYADSNYYGTAYWTHSTIDGVEPQRYPDMQSLTGDDSALIMDKALDFIQRAEQDDTPFLAVIWFHTPHLPIVYDSGLDASLYSDNYFDRFSASEKEYALTVTAMDTALGRLRSELSTLGLKDDTMLWFTSDNGPERGYGSAGTLRGIKRQTYEGGVRVLGVLEWPAVVQTHRETEVPAVTSDYYPTIMDILDIDVPNQPFLDGVSLKNVIEDPSVSNRGSGIGIGANVGSKKHTYAWIRSRYKVVAVNTSSGFKYEMFDIKNDPNETTDISGSQPEKFAEFKAELIEWLDGIDTSLPR